MPGRLGEPPSPPFYSPVSTHGAQAPQGGPAHSAFMEYMRKNHAKYAEASRLSESPPPFPWSAAGGGAPG